MINAKEARKNYDARLKVIIEDTITALSRKIPETSRKGHASVKYFLTGDGLDVIYKEVKKELKKFGYKARSLWDKSGGLTIEVSW